MANRPSDTVRLVNPRELATPPGYSHVAEVSGGRLVYIAGIAGQTASDRHGRLVGGDDLGSGVPQSRRRARRGRRRVISSSSPCSCAT